MKTLILAMAITMIPVTSHALDQDKKIHAGAGAAIGYFGTMAAGEKAGVLLSCGAGAAKELYDSTGKGTPEFADLLATCGTGLLVSRGVDWLFFDVIETTPILGVRFSWE